MHTSNESRAGVSQGSRFWGYALPALFVLPFVVTVLLVVVKSQSWWLVAELAIVAVTLSLYFATDRQRSVRPFLLSCLLVLVVARSPMLLVSGLMIVAVIPPLYFSVDRRR